MTETRPSLAEAADRYHKAAEVVAETAMIELLTTAAELGAVSVTLDASDQGDQMTFAYLTTADETEYDTADLDGDDLCTLDSAAMWLRSDYRDNWEWVGVTASDTYSGRAHIAVAAVLAVLAPDAAPAPEPRPAPIPHEQHSPASAWALTVLPTIPDPTTAAVVLAMAAAADRDWYGPNDYEGHTPAQVAGMFTHGDLDPEAMDQWLTELAEIGLVEGSYPGNRYRIPQTAFDRANGEG